MCRHGGIAERRRKAPLAGHGPEARCASAELDKIPAKNERPVRGDNRTGQAIWALGVDGRSRRIQPRWGGINAPTPILSAQRRQTFKPPPIFLGLLAGTFGDYRAAVGRVEVAPPDHAAYASGWYRGPRPTPRSLKASQRPE